MKNRILLLSLSAAAAAIIASEAHAQSSNYTVVATCGTLTLTQQTSGAFIDNTGKICTSATGGGGAGAVYGPTAGGSPAANPPVQIGGTADGTNTGTVEALKVDSSHQAATHDADVLAAVTGPIPAQSTKTVNIGNVGGIDASGATVTGQPLLDGGRAATAAPTAVTDGQAVAQLMGETGKQVTLPYAIKENAVRGAANTTGTGATTLIASAGGSLKNYITGLQCGRTDAGATAITLTFSDAATTILVLPAGGATNLVFQVPLVTAAATAFTVTSGTGVTTLYCAAQGFVGL